jgi:hypothetical protein
MSISRYLLCARDTNIVYLHGVQDLANALKISFFLHRILIPFLGLDGSCLCVVFAAAANIPYREKRGGTTIVITTPPRQHGAISYATRDCHFSWT